MLIFVLAGAMLALVDTLPTEQHRHQVTHLPGAVGGALKETQYAGFLPTGKDDGHIFYWLFGSRAEWTADTPLLVWLQGGPGASSMTGLMFENGPFTLQPNLTLTRNEWSWNTDAHVVYFDQPVGTGFSYCADRGYVTSEREAAEQLRDVIVQLLLMHPVIKECPLFLTGER